MFKGQIFEKKMACVLPIDKFSENLLCLCDSMLEYLGLCSAIVIDLGQVHFKYHMWHGHGCFVIYWLPVIDIYKQCVGQPPSTNPQCKKRIISCSISSLYIKSYIINIMMTCDDGFSSMSKNSSRGKIPFSSEHCHADCVMTRWPDVDHLMLSKKKRNSIQKYSSLTNILYI